jgi:hypothetical protein
VALRCVASYSPAAHVIELHRQVDEWRVKEQTLERLHALQPLLSEIMDVKLVVQPRKNMINIRVKPE